MSFETQNLRNVALLGHTGSGKTTFTECMLFEAGDITRMGSVEERNTQSDYTNIERERGNSIFASLTHAEWKDSKINIIDTPGFDDFVGEVVSALKVADTGIMMLNAQNGVEVGTELIWDYVSRFETPCLFVINQVDHEKADFEQTLAQAQARFGEKVVPVQYPISTGVGFHTIVDALRMVMYVFPDGGGKPEKVPIPEAELGRAQEMHNALVEAAAENDEGLMERFFDEGSLTEEELTEGLRIAIAHQQLFPVFVCSAVRNMGSGRIMGFINDICPSPADRPAARLEGEEATLPCDAEEDTTVFIYKTMTEPQVGMVSYFKVYAGTLSAGDELINAKNGTAERFGQLFIAEGKNREAVPRLKAGDIGVTVKLKNSHTNNTLNIKGIDRQIRLIDFPEPRIREAVQPLNANDMEKLIKALHQIEEEDPTLIVEQSAALRQTILHGQGQLHLDLIRYRIEKVNQVSMEFARPRISYRETITRAADSMYRHKKQSGGAGQFAEVHLRIDPWEEGMADPQGLSVRNKEVEELPWGGKLAFYWCIVGGSIDAKYANAIKKGLMQRMEEGPLTGSPCQDIRVCIYDGKMHAVDSNDMAFMLATKQAFRQAFRDASPQLLEPVYQLDILCSDESMGDIMGDLQTRRAMIMGMDSDGHYQKITAHVPLAELYEYSSRLRSLSQGRAKFHQEFLAYQPVPGDLQAELMKAHEEATAEA
ncbi:elongation factor G [Phaeodactylibacter luteus]|uniref:Elongation factor G n=1 Tax=Phaeodactylibacter luteus TaxID=1564516 RepID=A0A5C6RT04_9BACT|nr:elongation factor G [Phaeodactylibacter luteus]TXB65576.1 elongation factor G [Phaeodactylibacter luteus]